MHEYNEKILFYYITLELIEHGKTASAGVLAASPALPNEQLSAMNTGVIIIIKGENAVVIAPPLHFQTGRRRRRVTGRKRRVTPS